MDCISPDHLDPQLSDIFIKVSLNAIRAAIPFAGDDTEESHAEKYLAAVELFRALKPRDADEAALATRYVIGHVRYLHLSACAAARDLPDDKALRLNAAAATADRLANTTRRAIKAAQKPAPGLSTRGPAPGLSTRGPAPGPAPGRRSSQPDAPAEPQSAIAPDNLGPFDDPTLGPLPQGADGWVRLVAGGRPIPHITRFQPRDRHGEPIPYHRRDLMTTAQFRASLASPRDPALEAIAIAEEEEMIAAQSMQQAEASRV